MRHSHLTGAAVGLPHYVAPQDGEHALLAAVAGKDLQAVKALLACDVIGKCTDALNVSTQFPCLRCRHRGWCVCMRLAWSHSTTRMRMLSG